MPRSIFTIAIFTAVLFGPWWLSFLLIFIGIVFFDFAVESILAAFLIDMFYGVDLPRVIDGPFVVSLVAIVLFVVKRFLKPYIFVNK